MYLLPISGLDLILGANWLKTIGPHVADYASLNWKFLHNDKFVTPQRDVDHIPMQAHLHHVRRMVKTKAIAEVYTMQMVDTNNVVLHLPDLPEDINPQLAVLLRNYASVLLLYLLVVHTIILFL